MAGPDIKGALEKKYEKFEPKQSTFGFLKERLTDSSRWKQLASESAVGRAAGIGQHMKDLYAGKAKPDPMLAFEAAGLATGLGRGGGGPANLGMIQKDLLKQAATGFRTSQRLMKGLTNLAVDFSKTDALRKKIIKGHMQGIQHLPDVVASEVPNIKIPMSMRPTTLGSINRGSRTVSLNPFALKNSPSTAMHEGTHAVGRGDILPVNLPVVSRAEKLTNFKSAMFDEIAGRFHKELTPIQQRFMYKNIPHEQMSQKMAKKYTEFKPETYANRADADKAYLSAYNKEANALIEGLHKTAPKVYKKAMKGASKRMQRIYGKDWKKGITRHTN